MKFAVLGPLTVSTTTEDFVALGGRRQSILLAFLLFHANELVPVDRLVEAMWEDEPPQSYLSNLHTYLARLRSRLPNVRIDLLDRRCRLSVQPDDLDLLVFRREAAAGRTAARVGDSVAASAHFLAALGLWRDRPLSGLSVTSLEPEIVRLSEERMSLLEERMTNELLSARHDEIIPELRALVAEHPLRERLHTQLMTALYQAGRQADALTAYQRARANMVTELGVEPGAELQRAHDTILQGGVLVPTGPVNAMATPVGAMFPLCQLPPDIPDFVGRVNAIGKLTDRLMPDRPVVPLVLISGDPGAGKSALAVRVAHALRASFPDGQLFVQLAGASANPRSPADVLMELLRALGVATSAIPETLEARATAFRARLADRRVLVVLDDAANPAQVRTLIPGTPGCAVLLTSRSRLSGLVGTDTCRLDSMDKTEARELLTGLTGAPRMTGEPAAVTRILTACGGLPLALRIAGIRLATRPHLLLGSFADRLEDEQRRLDELAVSDLEVRASLATGYQGLHPAARSAFRFLGLLGAVDVAAWAVAVLLDVLDADPVIEELVEANLLQPVGRDATGEPRYRLHDLLRVYAAERAYVEDDEEARLAAHRRLFTALLGLADEANQRDRRMVMYRISGRVPPTRLPDAVVRRLVADPMAWFAAERRNLLVFIGITRGMGRHREAAQLSNRMNEFLWLNGYWTDLREQQQAVLADTRRSGDELAQAKAECMLAAVRFTHGDLTDVTSTYERCGPILERLGDWHGLACMLVDYADCLTVEKRFGDSLHQLVRANQLFRAENDMHGHIATLRGQSMVFLQLEQFEQSLRVAQHAVTLARASDGTRLLALCLAAVARVHLALDELDSSRLASREAQELLDGLGDRSKVLWYIYKMRALSEAALGHRQVAVSFFERARTLAVELVMPLEEAAAGQAIAASWIGDGRAAEAITMLRRSAEESNDLGFGLRRASTLHLLAAAHESLGQHTEAAQIRHEAERLGSGDGSDEATLKALLALAAPNNPVPIHPESAV